MLKSPEVIKSTKVIKEPLRVLFFYESGNAKGGSVEVIHQSEWDNIALEQGQKLPDDREPFFTKEETTAAKRAIAQLGIRIA